MWYVMHVQVLEDISDRSRDLIFELVRSKADDLLAGMEFVNMEPTSMRRQAHSYADDLINYLRVGLTRVFFFVGGCAILYLEPLAGAS